MARELTFRFKGKEYPTMPVKVERKKLYGWSEILALDDNGEPFKLVSTDYTGTFIIPKGGTGMGILSPEGEWVERSELVLVKEDGSPAELLPSSFDAPVELHREVSIEEFLDYSITAFYQLGDAPEELVKAIGRKIYTFPFCYIEDCDANPAFVLGSEDSGNGKTLFMLIGYSNRFEMLSLQQPGLIDETDEDLDGEDIDFSMF